MISGRRLAPKLTGVVEDLRGRIVRGEFLPGAKLPVRSELESLYEVSWATLQKACDVLREDGFVETRGRNGTFVTGYPPHLCEYGLVLPYRPDEAFFWSRYYATLQQEAINSPRTQGRRLSAYYAAHGDITSRDCRQLLQDANRHRLAGVVLTGVSGQLAVNGFLPKWLPKVAIRPMQGCDAPSVDPDHMSFWHRALGYLRSRGRRRVGCFRFVESSHNLQRIMQLFQDYGMEVRPYWALNFEGTQSPVSAAHLLTRLPKEDRPEALIISDDNLVESAMAGLVAGGIRVPDELELVIHCNFPNPPPAVLPAKRIGFDCRELLQVCCNMIDMQRRGEAPPPSTVLSAVMEEELPLSPDEQFHEAYKAGIDSNVHEHKAFRSIS